jgi:hypothetical protein
LAPIIKEPPGTWDPVHDKFHDQQNPRPVDMGDMHGQEDTLSRKTLKKGGQEPPKADAGKGSQEALRDMQRHDGERVEDKKKGQDTDKKKGQDTGKAADMASNVKGQPDPQKPMQKPGEGSGAVVNGNKKVADDDEVEIEEYDPAAGSCQHRSL